ADDAVGGRGVRARHALERPWRVARPEANGRLRLTAAKEGCRGVPLGLSAAGTAAHRDGNLVSGPEHARDDRHLHLVARLPRETRDEAAPESIERAVVVVTAAAPRVHGPGDDEAAFARRRGEDHRTVLPLDG